MKMRRAGLEKRSGTADPPHRTPHAYQRHQAPRHTTTYDAADMACALLRRDGGWGWGAGGSGRRTETVVVAAEVERKGHQRCPADPAPGAAGSTGDVRCRRMLLPTTVCCSSLSAAPPHHPLPLPQHACRLARGGARVRGECDLMQRR